MPLELTPQQPPYYDSAVQGISLKQYTALLTQTGTNAPTPTIIKNTIGTITWTRLGAGTYKATATALLTLNKTTVFITPTTSSRPQISIDLANLPNYILIEIWAPTVIAGVYTTTPADDLLNQTPITIYVNN